MRVRSELVPTVRADCGVNGRHPRPVRRDSMEEEKMRRVILASIVLVALALVIAPALATPATYAQKVTWKGATVATNGASVKFSGVMTMNEVERWTGSGRFVDKDSGLVADFVFLDVWPYGPMGDEVSILGEADLSVAGVTYRRCELTAGFDWTTGYWTFQFVAPGGMAWVRTYEGIGDDLHVRVT